MLIEGGTGCGDYRIRGFYDLPTEKYIDKLKKEFLLSLDIVYNEKSRWEESGFIYVAIIPTRGKTGRAWVKELRKLGMKISSQGINAIHNHDRHPLVCMTIHTGSVADKYKEYWKK